MASSADKITLNPSSPHSIPGIQTATPTSPLVPEPTPSSTIRMQHPHALQMIKQRMSDSASKYMYKRSSVSSYPEPRPLCECELAALRVSVRRELEKRYAGCIMLIKDPKFLYILGADLAPEPLFFLGQDLVKVFGQEILHILGRARIFQEMGVMWTVERFTEEYIAVKSRTRDGFPAWCTNSSE